ncbi:MAG: hypothetical protein ACERKV_01110 [Clostridiaceae bacterium]
MTEEQVTKGILKWLIAHQWKIICFDFPQSGTGHFLHPNSSAEKNKDSINPDIVAVKHTDCIFFENKDRFYYFDYEKVNRLIVDNQYTDDISVLLSQYIIKNYFYGIGLPTKKHDKRSIAASHLVDFIIGVNEDRNISLLYKANEEVEKTFS